MKTKKKHPVLSKPKPLRYKAKKLRQRRGIIIALILLIAIAGYFMWSKSSPQSETPAGNSPMATEPVNAEPPATPSIEALNGVDDDSIDNDSIDNDSVMENTTVDGELDLMSPDAILNAPLPDTDGLAKEEIDRLEDERQRMSEQEQSAAEQVTMNKKLTDMKAEQIALLEEQIAQLESNKGAATNAQ